LCAGYADENIGDYAVPAGLYESLSQSP
jgi:hypothetical protein